MTTTTLTPASALRTAIALHDAASLANGDPNYDHLGIERGDQCHAGNLYTTNVDGPGALPCVGWVATEDEDSPPHEYTMPEPEFRRQWRETGVVLRELLAASANQEVTR